jgi:protein-disulfide isomerase
MRSLADPRHAERIREDQALAGRLGAAGTPNFFINGRLLTGALPVETFQALIDEELRKADALVQGGVKPEAVYAKLMERGVDRPPAPAEPPVQKLDVGASPTRGPKDAPVTVVVFSDFECPFCARAVPTLQQLENEYGGRLRVVFKHVPLPNHPNARLAAAASLAAHEQGRFWEFHDVLFANQRALDRASLERHAQQVGLDLGRFRSALDSGRFEAQVAADAAEGARVGAQGTPTFFINGRTLVGALPIEQFRRLIDDELRKAGRGAR